MTHPGEIRGPGGPSEALPGQAPSCPTPEEKARFALYADSAPYPPNVGKALEDFLKTGAQQWKSTTDSKYYRVTPSDEKSTKSNTTFYTSVYIYNKKPGRGVKPSKSYPKAYWVDEKKGEYQNQYRVYYMQNGKKVADPSMDYSPPPHNVPSNFSQFKKKFPNLFKEFYEAFIFGTAMRMIKQMRKNQLKMKKAMRGELG